MKKILSLLLIISSIGFANDKTVKIGSSNWLTEENTIEEVTAYAKKDNKSIIAVFSATWCGPCQAMKHDIFIKDEFKVVAEKVILLYIEQTNKKSTPYLKKIQYQIFSNSHASRCKRECT